MQEFEKKLEEHERKEFEMAKETEKKINEIREIVNRLPMIEAQTIKTNGRVNKAEDEILKLQMDNVRTNIILEDFKKLKENIDSALWKVILAVGTSTAGIQLLLNLL